MIEGDVPPILGLEPLTHEILAVGLEEQTGGSIRLTVTVPFAHMAQREEDIWQQLVIIGRQSSFQRCQVYIHGTVLGQRR